MEVEAGTIYEEIPNDAPETEATAAIDNATLDFFLSADAEAEQLQTLELKRLGVVFTIHDINDEQLNRCIKRAEARQTKQDKARGVAPERDRTKMENLIIVEGTKYIQKRLRSVEEAAETGQPEFADKLELRDERLLAKNGPRPEDFLSKWLLPGERTQLADLITDLSGYESGAVVAAGN